MCKGPVKSAGMRNFVVVLSLVSDLAVWFSWDSYGDNRKAEIFKWPKRVKSQKISNSGIC